MPQSFVYAQYRQLAPRFARPHFPQEFSIPRATMARFYTTTAAATLLANLAIREDMCDWSDSRKPSPSSVLPTPLVAPELLMAAAERIRDLIGVRTQ